MPRLHIFYRFLRSTEESGKERYKGDTDEGNTTTGHELLHALALCTGVILTVALHQVDCSPDTKTCTKSYYKSLKYAYCAVEKCHNVVWNRIFVLLIFLFISCDCQRNWKANPIVFCLFLGPITGSILLLNLCTLSTSGQITFAIFSCLPQSPSTDFEICAHKNTALFFQCGYIVKGHRTNDFRCPLAIMLFSCRSDKTPSLRCLSITERAPLPY